MRTVRQLAIDERDRFPRAADVASHELYMDDLTTSVPTVDEGKSEMQRSECNCLRKQTLRTGPWPSTYTCWGRGIYLSLSISN